jgi:hypothetical protein
MQRTLDSVHKLAVRNDCRLRTLMELLHRTGGLSIPQTAANGESSVTSPAAHDGFTPPEISTTTDVHSSVGIVRGSIAVPLQATTAAAAATAVGRAPDSSEINHDLTAQPPNLEFLTHLTTSGSDGVRGLSAVFPGIDESGGMGILLGSAVPPDLIQQHISSQGRSLSHLLSRHTSDLVDVGVMFDQSRFQQNGKRQGLVSLEKVEDKKRSRQG